MYATSQALVSSLEKKDNENDSPTEHKEGTHILKEEESVTDDVSVDNEMTNKLAAENKELYVSFCDRFILFHYKFCGLCLLSY